LQPPRTPGGPPRGPSGPSNGPSNTSGSSGPYRSNNSNSPRPYNSGPAGASSSGAPRPAGSGYQGNNPRPAGATGGYAPRPPYQGGAPRPAGGGYQGNNPRPVGSFGPRPFTPRGTGFVKEKSKDDLRINFEINVPNVRLVGEDGEMIGVVETKEALRRAEEAGLDLVEVSPAADPPVCKIIDYGKYKYEQEKKAAEARKKQKVIEIKELKLRPNIGDHDYQIKIRQAKEFLEEGDKVKFTLRFKGREMSHAEIGTKLMNRVKQDLLGIVRVDQEPKFEGRQVIMVMSPAAKS